MKTKNKNKLLYLVSILIFFVVILPFTYVIFAQGINIIPVSSNNALYERLSKPNQQKSHMHKAHNGMSMNERLHLRWAIRKFPSLQSCQTNDQKDFKWASIKTGSQLELCIHHLIQSVGKQGFVNWLENENIDYNTKAIKVFENGSYNETGETQYSIGLTKKTQSKTEIRNSNALFVLVANFFNSTSVAAANVIFDNQGSAHSIQVTHYNQT